MTGIYSIINSINGHCYIGSSMDLDARKKGHFNALCKGKHVNTYLQNAYNLYKENAFIFCVLEYCDKKILIQREQFWIDNYKIRGEILYNICPIAYSRIGTKLSEETKAKISQANKGKTYGRVYKPQSIEQKEAQSQRQTGKKLPPLRPETKEKLRQINLGKHHTKEARTKISVRFKDKPLSKEHREKISKSIKEHWATRRTSIN